VDYAAASMIYACRADASLAFGQPSYFRNTRQSMRFFIVLHEPFSLATPASMLRQPPELRQRHFRFSFQISAIIFSHFTTPSIDCMNLH